MVTEAVAASLRQGSEAWHAKHLGKVSPSRFADVLTQPRTNAAKARGELSQTSRSYMLDLLAERFTREPQGPRETEAMRWGKRCESAAVRVYELLTGASCREVGFVDHPTEPHIGGSPDRLVGDDGGLEVKCPFNTRIHLEYYLGGVVPKEHVAQVQGYLWITGRRWWDFVSYDPRIPDLKLALFRVRVARDDPYIDTLSSRVVAFRDAMLAAADQLIEGLNE